jgi:phenylacetate-CoA ligase
MKRGLPKMVGTPYILEPELEAMPRPKLRELQNIRLRKTVETCYSKMELYNTKFKEAGIKPQDIKTVADLKRLPFTEKEDLRARYPLKGLLAVPMTEVVRCHMTSGTTGKPVLSPFTSNDLNRWITNFARLYAAGGMGPGDIYQVMWGFGLFLGGYGVALSAERLGATVIPAGSALPSKTQLNLMQDLHPTCISATPSFILHIMDTAKELGIDVGKLGVEAIFYGAEACDDKTREKIMNEWKCKTLLEGYGLCELKHLINECEDHSGLHFWEDQYIPEILDPETKEPLNPGERGMLVVTTVLQEAMPMIRFLTKDITAIMEDPCVCGRTNRKIRRLMGRTDDMVKVKGVAVYPSQIEHVIRSTPETSDSEFQILVDRSAKMVDTLTVRVEAREPSEKLVKKLEESLKSTLFINAHVELVKYGSLPRFTHKAQRLIDTRTMYDKK